jgi:DNA-directed RNA polymerase subunit RPC12/RpoP
MSTTVFCAQCKEKVSMNNVRYASNGKELVCKPCMSREPADLLKQSAERNPYHCMGCNYKFSIRKDSRLTRKCPYCSSEKIVLRNEITSQTVLRDVTVNPDFVMHR